LGVRHVDMPCTPERVWRAIVAARAGALSDPWREPPEIFDHLAAPAGHVPDSSDEEMDL
jgi:carbon-monoxide dehydrogenase large subunit